VDGAGQLYNGEGWKALGFAAGSILGWFLVMYEPAGWIGEYHWTTEAGSRLLGGAVVKLTAYTWAAGDAYLSANWINMAREYGRGTELPTHHWHVRMNPERRGRRAMLALTYRT
jgi:hypothetical protein